MSTRVASIFAEIGLDSSKFTTGAKGILNGLGDILGSFGKLPGIIGVAATAFGIIADKISKMEQAAVSSAKEDAKLEAVLESTGYKAGLTARQLDDLATSMSKASGVDDELIKGAEAVMLTFTQIGGEVFPQAMQSASDMAAVLGGDLQGKVTMIGKAMNDFTGYTALKRAGVSFTEEQIKQIKNFKDANDLMGYQKLILNELATEYGGAAKAINDAGDGSENLKIASENLNEEIGKRFIPATRMWNELWTKVFDNWTKGVSHANAQNEAMRKLGITWVQGMGYVQNGSQITYEAAQAAIQAQIALDGEAESLKVVAESAEMSEAALQSMTETNKDMVSLTASFTQAEQSYFESSKSLEEERQSLLLKRADLIKKGYSETSQAVKDVDKALENNQTKINEAADEYEKATNRIILGYMQQQFMADGVLTDDEVNWLLAKGVAWGIYSETAVEKMKLVQAEWEGWEPGDKNATFTITTKQIQEGAVVDWSNGYYNSVGQWVQKKHANGADFIVPPGFPNDSYKIGVQSGEHVQVTPASQVKPPEAAIDYRKLADTLVYAMKRAGVTG